MQPTVQAPAPRLISLDVFRGLTVMMMLIVNNPGGWGHIYAPLEHAPWNGCTPTDLVFPFFLFIVGVSVAYALAGAKAAGAPTGPVLARVARRAATLFALGVFTSLYPKFGFSTVRILGVLQRIALVYFGCSLVYLLTGWRTQAALVLLLLVGYAVLMQLVPVPGYGPANLQPETNLGAWLDRTVIGEAHLWKTSRTWDPEGLLGTLPALGTGLLGCLAGQWLRTTRQPNAKAGGLLAAGVVAVAAGLVWNQWFPINKALWTSSYVLYTAGLALGLLAVLYWLCDVQGWRGWWTALPVAAGVNAIAVFFGSAILSRTMGLLKLASPKGTTVGLKEWLYQWHIAPHFADPYNASLAGAVLCLLIWLVVLVGLRRQGWIWKV